MKDLHVEAALRGRRDRRLPVPEGSSCFALTLGFARVRVEALPTPFEPFVREDYAPFAERLAPEENQQGASAPSSVALTLRCRQSEAAARGGSTISLPLPAGDEPTRVELALEAPRRVALRSHWQEGFFDLDAGLGEIVFGDRTWDRFAMSLENYLRVLVQKLALERDALVVHAAAVLESEGEDARAHLFVGPSGAGKSTAAFLSAPRPLVSDDLALVELSGEGARVHALPFFAALDPAARRLGSWPLAGIHRLRQAERHRLEPLSRARAVASLSSALPFARALGADDAALAARVAALCRRVPVDELHFAKDGGFWELFG